MTVQIFSAAATAVFIVMGFVVGLRMLLLARRTGELPELALGAALFLIVGVGYPLFLASATAPDLSLDTGRVLAALSTLCMNVGWAFVCIFTWRVFRANERWARVAAVACGAALALLTVGRFADLAAATSRPELGSSGLSLRATQAFALAVYVWTGVEALLCHARLRRQQALGLIEPVVVNRVLLWAWVAGFCFTSVLVGFVAGLLGIRMEQATWVQLLSAITGLGCAGALYLAFFPPRSYLRRVEGATA